MTKDEIRQIDASMQIQAEIYKLKAERELLKLENELLKEYIRRLAK